MTVVQIPLEKLYEFDPFVHSPWGVRPLTCPRIDRAIQLGRLNQRSYTGRARYLQWLERDHVARVAYLVLHRDLTPVDLDVGVPVLGHFQVRLTDGYHRLGAALYRGDATIAACISGQLSRVFELYGVHAEEAFQSSTPARTQAQEATTATTRARGRRCRAGQTESLGPREEHQLRAAFRGHPNNGA